MFAIYFLWISRRVDLENLGSVLVRSDRSLLGYVFFLLGRKRKVFEGSMSDRVDPKTATNKVKKETIASKSNAPSAAQAKKKTPLTENAKAWIAIGVIFAVLLISVLAIVIVFLVLPQRGKQAAKVPKHLQDPKKWVNYKISPIAFTEAQRNQLVQKYSKISEYWNSTIMVSISSYRDSELCLTLRDLIEKAVNPSRLSICVVEQNDYMDEYTCHAKNILKTSLPIKKDQLRVKTIHWSEAKGPTYARAMCEGLWKGEKYYLMVDSHMRFEPGWDCELIEQLWLCPRPLKTVLTMYPEGYERFQDDRSNTINYHIAKTRGWRREIFKRFNEDGIIHFESITTYDAIPKNPRYVPFWGACFHFSHSDILKEVPFHPDTPYLFFGEELFMGARFFTHGWDLKGPTHSLVYHLWKRDHRKTFWNHNDENKRQQSVQKIKSILMGSVVDPKYGLGTARNIQEYWKYIGVDFNTKALYRPSDPWTLPPDFQPIKDAFRIFPENETLKTV